MLSLLIFYYRRWLYGAIDNFLIMPTGISSLSSEGSKIRKVLLVLLLPLLLQQPELAPQFFLARLKPGYGLLQLLVLLLQIVEISVFKLLNLARELVVLLFELCHLCRIVLQLIQVLLPLLHESRLHLLQLLDVVLVVQYLLKSNDLFQLVYAIAEDLVLECDLLK